jgi:hypothetical protein
MNDQSSAQYRRHLSSTDSATFVRNRTLVPCTTTSRRYHQTVGLYLVLSLSVKYALIGPLLSSARTRAHEYSLYSLLYGLNGTCVWVSCLPQRETSWEIFAPLPTHTRLNHQSPNLPRRSMPPESSHLARRHSVSVTLRLLQLSVWSILWCQTRPKRCHRGLQS